VRSPPLLLLTTALQSYPSINTDPHKANSITRADRSSVTFQGAFSTAQKTNNLTASTQVYAVFLSGLQKFLVPAYITNGNADYKIDRIPAVDAGQVYAILSTSPTSVDVRNSITGPTILQVYPMGKAPAIPVPPCL